MFSSDLRIDGLEVVGRPRWLTPFILPHSRVSGGFPSIIRWSRFI